MDKNLEFQRTFERLKSILMEFSGALVSVKNEPNEYYLNTRYMMKNKKPMFFGAVKVTKNYVSYHLMPVYVFPELLANISPELKHQMQGKSCFSFKAPDAELFTELAELTKAGYQKYEKAAYVFSW